LTFEFPQRGQYNASMDYLSFDPMASVYDSTRIYDSASFSAVLDYIAVRFPPQKYPELFEPGIGTGRIAIPLAERDYSVTGADISTEMLRILAEKLERRPELPVRYIRQDITALPFLNASFDIAVVVHVFHLIRQWKKAVNEVFRILKPESPLIMLYTGGGKEVPWVQDRYRELCRAGGHPAEHIGTGDRQVLMDYFREIGCRVEIIEDRWQWVRKNTVRECFEGIKARSYGMTRLVTEEFHHEVAEKLQAETVRRYGSLDVEVEVPMQMRLIIAAKEPA
jgi:ubiquinone/menaquinone biosynthesis C-methylase UbiE